MSIERWRRWYDETRMWNDMHRRIDGVSIFNRLVNPIDLKEEAPWVYDQIEESSGGDPRFGVYEGPIFRFESGWYLHDCGTGGYSLLNEQKKFVLSIDDVSSDVLSESGFSRITDIRKVMSNWDHWLVRAVDLNCKDKTSSIISKKVFHSSAEVIHAYKHTCDRDLSFYIDDDTTDTGWFDKNEDEGRCHMYKAERIVSFPPWKTDVYSDCDTERRVEISLQEAKDIHHLLYDIDSNLPQDGTCLWPSELDVPKDVHALRERLTTLRMNLVDVLFRK